MAKHTRSIIAIAVTAVIIAGCRSGSGPAQRSASAGRPPAVSTETNKPSSSSCLVIDPSGAPSGYTLGWSDDFHGDVGAKPNKANWRYDIGTGDHGWGNNELETYVDDQAHCHIVSDRDATDGYALQIQTTRNGNIYKSARINTFQQVAFKYGYIEARIKVPAGKGIWPGFWMMGNDLPIHGWPGCGEMNAMDIHGDTPGVNRASITGAGFTSPHIESTYMLPGGASFAGAYHRFAIAWEPQSITFYVDGKTVGTKTPANTPQRTWPFDKPFFLLLDLAVGGNVVGSPTTATHFPASMRIDYVRVYKKGSATGTAFNGPHYVPGIVQCEDFDDGGEGIAYHDNDGVNQSENYRPAEGVDIEEAHDPNAGYAVGWTAAGQWLKYTVIAAKSGTFTVGFRVSAGDKGGRLHLEDETGKDISGSVVIGSTGGWQNWTTVTKRITLNAGKHTLKLVEDTGGYNLDYLTFTE